jgi:hypothetical protein
MLYIVITTTLGSGATVALSVGVGVGFRDGVGVGFRDGVGVGFRDGVGVGFRDGVGDNCLLSFFAVPVLGGFNPLLAVIWEDFLFMIGDSVGGV